MFVYYVRVTVMIILILYRVWKNLKPTYMVYCSVPWQTDHLTLSLQFNEPVYLIWNACGYNSNWSPVDVDYQGAVELGNTNDAHSVTQLLI